MPNVVLKYQQGLFTPALLKNIGLAVRPIVAQYCSCAGVELVEEDIDWDPMEIEPGAIMPSFSMRIETYDYTSRIKKLTKELTQEMKDAIAKAVYAASGMYRPPDTPWLWVFYASQHGHHV